MSTPTRTDAPAEPIDLRLVVTDLDGTLLDGDGRLPDRLWQVLDRLASRGITWAPASGRQYATLRRMFGTRDGMAFIAENGTYVVCAGREVGGRSLDRGFVHALIRETRSMARAGRDIGLVWCGRQAAYVDRTDDRFVTEVGRYFAALEIVDDLCDVDEDPAKLSIVDFGGSAEPARLLQHLSGGHQLVRSNTEWLEVLNQGVNKGAAVRMLQRELGVTPEQTVVFGDYLNDLEMISQAPHSFAVANAHPQVIEAARYLAPSNADGGVLVVLERLLDTAERAA